MQAADSVKKGKLCEADSTCSFKISSSTVSEESNTGAAPRQDKKIVVTYRLDISSSHMTEEGYHSWLLNAVDYKEQIVSVDLFGQEQVMQNKFTNPEMAGKEQKLAGCIEASKFGVQQSIETGELKEFLVEESPAQTSEGLNCTEHEDKIKQVYVGSATAIAGTILKAESSTLLNETNAPLVFDETLIEFDTVEHDMIGEKRANYRHEVRDDGRVIVHHKSRTVLPQLLMSVPTDDDNDSMMVTTAGSSQLHNGATEEVSETTKTDLGTDTDDSKMYSCGKTNLNNPLGSGGSTCEDIPDSLVSPQQARLKSATETTTTRIKDPELIQLDPISRIDFLETARASGRPMKFVPAVQMYQHIKSYIRPNSFDANLLAKDTPGSKKFVKWLQRASHEDLTKAETVNQLSRLMVPPVVRETVVQEILSKRIDNPSALMVLMEAIGNTLSRSAGAEEQLITLASSKQLSSAARQQALVGLIQVRCYDHSVAIRRLSGLSQTPLEAMALHIQHGLIGHSGHCTDGKYNSGAQYSDLLEDVRTRLADAVANRNEKKALMLIDAVGNSQSQDPAHTQALIDVTMYGHTTKVRLLATENLGVLWTDAAQRHLKELGHSDDTELQEAALISLSGKYLHTADTRQPGTTQKKSAPTHSRRLFGSSPPPPPPHPTPAPTYSMRRRRAPDGPAHKQVNEVNWAKERTLAEALTQQNVSTIEETGSTIEEAESIQKELKLEHLQRRRAPVYRPEVNARSVQCTHHASEFHCL